jgi:hypothetical protein
VIDLVSFAVVGRRFRDAGKDQQREVRTWFEQEFGGGGGSGAVSTAPTRATTTGARSAPTSEPHFELEPLGDAGERDDEKPFPPIEGLQALWRATVPVNAVDKERRFIVPAAVDWMQRVRGLDVVSVGDQDLARALVRDVPEVAFAQFKSGARLFQCGYVVLIRLYDNLGHPRSIVLRSVRAGAKLKSVSPPDFRRTGLIMANALGVKMLRYGVHPSQWPAANGVNDPFPLDEPWWPKDELFCVLLCEGEPDWLSWCSSSAWSDANPYTPAVFGYFEGGWKREHAQRIPLGSRVVISQQPGAKGLLYTKAILETLRGRGDLDAVVWNAPSVPEDL